MKSTRESIRFLGSGLKTAIKYHMVVCLFDMGFTSLVIVFHVVAIELTQRITLYWLRVLTSSKVTDECDNYNFVLR